MTQELLTLDKWDTQEIETRQRELSEWVFEIWKFPGEAAPPKPVEAVEAEPETAAEPQTAALDQLPEVPA